MIYSQTSDQQRPPALASSISEDVLSQFIHTVSRSHQPFGPSFSVGISPSLSAPRLDCHLSVRIPSTLGVGNQLPGLSTLLVPCLVCPYPAILQEDGEAGDRSQEDSLTDSFTLGDLVPEQTEEEERRLDFGLVEEVLA